MPSSPAREPRSSSAHAAARSSSKPRVPTSPRRTQSHSPHGTPARPQPARRHTTYTSRPTPSPRPAGRASPAPAKTPTPRRRTSSTPARGSHHVLIPVPIRARDAESPVYIRAPSGQRIDFVFSEPKKRGIIGRLLDSVEWGGPQKPYRYRTPAKSNATGRPFYKLTS